MATVPITRTWVAGEVVTAAHFNTNIRDVLNYLLAPPILEITQTVAQAIANNTATALTFTTEVIDSSGMHSTVSNTSRATAVYPGYYKFWGGYSIASNATNARLGWGKVNATDVNASSFEIPPVNGFNSGYAFRTKTVFLNVTDYWEFFVLQNSGGSLNTIVATIEQSSLGGEWMSN